MLILCLRREHDRNNSGWLVWVYFIFSLLSDFLIFGDRLAPPGMGSAVDPLWGPAMSILSLVLLGGAVWLTVTLGLLDGTPGPNRYGPSPKGIGVADQ